jgi:hypothetical protein
MAGQKNLDVKFYRQSMDKLAKLANQLNMNGIFKLINLDNAILGRSKQQGNKENTLQTLAIFHQIQSIVIIAIRHQKTLPFIDQTNITDTRYNITPDKFKNLRQSFGLGTFMVKSRIPGRLVKEKRATKYCRTQ